MRWTCLCAVGLEDSSAEAKSSQRLRVNCLHCQGSHDSAGHQGLGGDVAMIKHKAAQRQTELLEVKVQDVHVSAPHGLKDVSKINEKWTKSVFQ